MALASKKYTRMYSTDGSDADKINSSKATKIQQTFESNDYLTDHIQFDNFSPLLYQIQKMQDELDYLRGEISTNKDKTSMALGTSGTTALAGDTKIISIGSNTTLSFGDLTETIIKGKATYTILLSATRDFGGKTGVLTKSSIITLI